MYAGAQSGRRPKGRIAHVRAGPGEGDGLLVAGPKPRKAWFARFPDAEISNSTAKECDHERIIGMLYTIAVVLIILWLLGLVTSYTMGGFIHILLVIAIVIVLLRVISGRNPL